MVDDNLRQGSRLRHRIRSIDFLVREAESVDGEIVRRFECQPQQPVESEEFGAVGVIFLNCDCKRWRQMETMEREDDLLCVVSVRLT